MRSSPGCSILKGGGFVYSVIKKRAAVSTPFQFKSRAHAKSNNNSCVYGL